VTSPKFRTSLRCFRSSLVCLRTHFALVGVLSCAACLLAAARNSPSQNSEHRRPYALIVGTVWGPDNHPVYGAKVRIRRADERKPRWELISNHTGEFAQRVPAARADYVIWADLKASTLLNGKHLQAGEESRVHVEYDERIDTSLHLR
jgi:hypothetical protein